MTVGKVKGQPKPEKTHKRTQNRNSHVCTDSLRAFSTSCTKDELVQQEVQISSCQPKFGANQLGAKNIQKQIDLNKNGGTDVQKNTRQEQNSHWTILEKSKAKFNHATVLFDIACPTSICRKYVQKWSRNAHGGLSYFF